MRKYLYKGNSLNASQLKLVLKNEGNEKRCRKRNIRYFEVIVDYEGIGQVKLFFCRFHYLKKFRLFLSTDISLSLLSMLEIYSIRWTIEVFFKETKQHLKLGTCQSRDFDAQIAHITTCYLLYMAKSGLLDILEFRDSVEYEYLKELFENSFLTNQLKALENAS